MTVLFIFAAAGLVTFGLRAGLVVVGDRLQLSDRFEATIALVPAAVLAAIVASALLVSDTSGPVPRVAELAAVVAGVVAVGRTGNIGASLMVGLPVYWLFALIGLV